jgi:hypothetical protein
MKDGSFALNTGEQRRLMMSNQVEALHTSFRIVLRLSPNSRARALMDRPGLRSAFSSIQISPDFTRDFPRAPLGATPATWQRPPLVFQPDVDLFRPAWVIKIGGKN